MLSAGLLAACAEPCVDDGLAQKAQCSADTEGNDGTGSAGTDPDSATQTATVTETESDPTVGTGTGGSYECPELDVTLEPQTPTIQVVLDRSGSMNQDFDGQPRWVAMRNTLVDPANGVISQLEADIRFGLSMYTTDGATCPVIDTHPPSLNAAEDIRMLIDGTAPGSETPTGESLMVALQTVLDDPFEGDKFLVLATDGEPDTCAVPNPQTDQEIAMARGAAVDAVVAAYDAGVRTFVISVGTQIAAEHLQDLANAGVGNGPNDPDAQFYQALDQASLVAAFNDIISGVRECKLDLDKPLTSELAPSCQVTINDMVVPYDDPNGWELDGETTIELLGTACDSIQEGTVTIGMSCTCEIG